MNNWNNSFCSNRQYLLSRRDILKGISAGFGYMAFAAMSTAQAAADVVRRTERNEAGQVLVFRTQTVQHPRTHRRANKLKAAGMQL